MTQQSLQLSPAEQLILGIIAEQPRHGYDIEMVIAERGMREWTDIGFSSIYYLLDKLKAKKFIQATTGGGSRKTYCITEAGTQACMAATKNLLVAEPAKTPLLVGLANSMFLPSHELAAALQERRNSNEQHVARIQKTLEQQQPLPAFVAAIFNHSLSQLRAENSWIQETIQKIKEETMDKIDFKKELKELYAPKNKDWEFVDVPTMNFLKIDGAGNPNTSPAYKEAVEALFSVSYTIKFMSKRQLDKDYGVAPLEGLWYADDMSVFETRDKDAFKWTMMIMQPEWITEEMVSQAVATVKEKKNPPALPKLRFEPFAEGKSLQLMHIGSYDDETPKLMYLHHEYMPQNNLKFNGNHHEIYIGDPRKSAPEKLKTILRQPVAQQTS
jgi:DNA-binding PadR family transcriptional regulator